MSEYAVILKNGNIVKVSNFGDTNNVTFDTEGGIQSFVYKGIKYIALFNTNTLIFDRYVDHIKFIKLDFDKDDIVEVNENLKEITFYQYGELAKAAIGDNIIDYLVDKEKTEGKICYSLNQWSYYLPYHGPKEEIPYPYVNQKTCAAINVNSHAAKFQSKFSDYEVLGGGKVDERLINEITALLISVDEEINLAFSDFVNTGLSTGIFNFIDNSSGTFTQEHFLNYKKALEIWVTLFKQNREDLKKYKDNAERLYIIAFSLLRYNMMELISVEEKLAMLRVFVKGSITGAWTKTFSSTYYSEEKIAVGIVKSITQEQVNKFMDLLVTPDASGETLIEALDSKINGDNKKDFYDVLLTNWKLSKYNPYSESGVLVESNMDQYNYNEKAPYTLAYRSEEFLGIYLNNFDFEFEKNTGYIEVKKKELIHSPNSYNGANGYYQSNFYGKYKFYQPVSLVDYNFDTTIKMPIIGAGENGISSVIPIFYLKFIDDTNDWQSFKSSLGLFVDVPLTFSGIGNLAKLKHLRNLSRLGQVCVWLGAVEASASMLDILIRVATNDCSHQTSEFCKRLQNYLLCLQLVTGGVDIIATKALRNSARKLREVESQYPASFTEDIKDMIRKHGDEVVETVTDDLAKIRKNTLDKVKRQSDLFNENHFTESQIDDLITFGIQQKMTPVEVEDFIFIACRKAEGKPIEFSELKIQMENWKNVIEPRGYPYKFTSKKEFILFKEKLKELVSKWGIPTDDVRVQGSSLRTPLANDVDIAIIITQEQLADVRNLLTERGRVNFGDKNDKFEKYLNFVESQINKGYIKNRQFGLMGSDEVSFMTELYSLGIFPKGEKLNVSIIIKEVNFDVNPYLYF